MNWLKALLYLLTIYTILLLAPEHPIDPWHLFSLKKLATMIFALSLIQFFGAVFVRFFGIKLGLILTGLMSGFISSTAATASLAKKSVKLSVIHTKAEALTFLSSTLAMLIEAQILLFIGLQKPIYPLYFLLGVPILVTGFLVIYNSKKIHAQEIKYSPPELYAIKSTLKLALFILLIISVSKIFQNILGQQSLTILTFAISLFEIHGSIIANLQLHESGSIDTKLLTTLIAISIFASYVSKIFLIYSIGSQYLKSIILSWVTLILGSFILSYSVYIMFY